jgi:hypothetical protein
MEGDSDEELQGLDLDALEAQATSGGPPQEGSRSRKRAPVSPRVSPLPSRQTEPVKSARTAVKSVSVRDERLSGQDENQESSSSCGGIGDSDDEVRVTGEEGTFAR